MNGSVAHQRVGAGSVRRAGFVIPSSNRRFEPEAAAFLPAGIVPHVARARMTGAAKPAPAVVLERILDAARCLADARCELVFMQCTANSMEHGIDGEQAMVEAMREATGKPCAATGMAVQAALAALGARLIGLATPYDRETTDSEVRYLAACGIECADVEAYALAGSDAYCSTPPDFWQAAMTENRRRYAAVDAVLVSCANIRSLEALDALAAAAGKPVIGSNQVALWFATRALGDERPHRQFGCLAERPLPSQWRAAAPNQGGAR